ncbi:glycosyltransferase family 2 protein [Rhizobium sp. NFR03]|uniref:glycosyltransferase family 2 protein n=1 Tax=Rhizobium sp. NFR03 TaxID=1566263 RepID=UPI0008D2A855|nr:glycosyltransferase family 2 protein [Rhizobium sp. NFR03]SER57005.1 Glycosyl transferase family 2 [Rhizobium sp. NFR03]
MIFSPLFGGLLASNSFPNEFERDVMSQENLLNGVTICAIAKNEGRYIVEWLAYHLAIGVDRIHVYSNESEDNQSAKLDAIARQDSRITWTEWKSLPGVSPQVSAYNDFLKRVSTPWVCFIDIDEFLVPLEDATITEWLSTIPSDVSSVHINWRGFGSAGVEDSNYQLVTRTFDMAAAVGWGNHHHFKTIARTDLATEAMIHNVITSSGRSTISDFSEFEMVNNGLSNRIVHHRIQINHYQCKTFEEFSARMRRGDANVPDGPGKLRDASIERFKQLDLNDERNTAIRRFDSEVDKQLEWFDAITAKL